MPQSVPVQAPHPRLKDTLSGLDTPFPSDIYTLDILVILEIGQVQSTMANNVERDRLSMSLFLIADDLVDRFEQRDVLSDLNDAIEFHRAALMLRPHGHPDRPMSFNSLGISLHKRFQKLGVLSDLDEAIALHRAVLELHPPGHSLRILSLITLASILHDKFRRRGVLSDLNEAIELHRAAFVLCPPAHSERIPSLHNLAVNLLDRFQQRGVLSDLDESIELHRAALVLHPPDHSGRSNTLYNLANSLRCRFVQQGVLSVLDEVIELHRAALVLRPPGHPDRSVSLDGLGCDLRDRFKQRGVLSDLDEAIELHRAALVFCSPVHFNQSMFLNNLAISLQDRFQQQGVLSDLYEAIELHRAALVLRPPGHFDRSTSLSNLAASLRVRFHRWGVLSDLDEATELHRAALVLRPPGHSGRIHSLHNLSNSLQDRFQQWGVLSDLDEAIELRRDALVLCTPGYSGQSMFLNGLAASLRSRFSQRGVLSDLDEAIELHRAALVLCPPGHSERSQSLDGLAVNLSDRFRKQGVLSDLDEAIELHRAALVLHPPGHRHRSMSLNYLATSLRERFQQWGIPSDLDEAIELLRDALVLCSPGYSEQFAFLHNLAISLLSRFAQRGVLSDHDESIELHRAVLALLPPGHSDRSSSLMSLALNLQVRFCRQGLSSDLDEAFRLYAQLSQISHVASRDDLHAAKSWAASAEKLKHDSALVAYQTTLKFLDQHVAILSSSSHHFDAVREATSSLAMDAFSCSVRHGALTTAVELVEQGRAVFWTQLARFRTPLDELSASGDTGEALAEEFKRLSFRLRNIFDASTNDQSQIRQLTMQWDDVVSRIRILPDFSHFLLPPLFSHLQKAAEDGPVIIVNASQYSCDALIVLNAQEPVHVPLKIAQADVSELSSDYHSLAEQFGSSDHELQLHKLVSLLRKLWCHIVSPVVEALRESKVLRGSRIWWCPTAEFTLLPLHAAGPYEQKSHNLSYFYISSYTPTLAALIRARWQVSRDASPQHFVAIGQANPDRGKELQCVAPELAAVAQHVAPVVSFTSLADSHATAQGALDALSQNQWLHLACHGMPDRKNPFESSFAMRDGPLTIRDIIRSHWQNPEFAFLSACHTTVGDESRPDESIHLAAAMQFSGFLSVIGSMWSVDDDVARQIVSAFYDNLVDSSGRLDCTRAAVALHKAVKTLRKKIPLEQQIVFVHIGV
ncbi:TPR-like protein [Suillus ampliporus]|nr:TPR-like protein [Suillus ampliporus]